MRKSITLTTLALAVGISIAGCSSGGTAEVTEPD